MKVIDQINGSALFAQSAYSATVATRDDLGRDITATYLTSHQDISNLMPKSESANFYPMTGNPSGFLTTHQSLEDYATTADLATKQDTLTFGYDEQDRINSINSSALAGGGDVPEDVMVESAIGYNAVNEISGYNGSAIAQYGAEKQWLVHDDTIVHISNSAQYAFGCNISALQRLMGIDETVLWEGSANTGTLNFTDPLTSFKEFKFYVNVPERGTNKVLTFYDAVNTVTPGFIQLTTTTMTTGSVVNDWWQGVYNINATVDTATYKSMSIYANGQYYKQCSTTACGTNASKLVVKKVIGIGRKQ